MLKHTLLLAATVATAWLALPVFAQAQVYRCGNSYSSAPCTGGQAVSVEPLVEVHPAERQPSSARHTQRLNDQREAREWDRTERELDKAQAAPAPPRPSKSNRSQCQAKQQRIQKIDELARRGASVKQMERLREERQAARDWQFRAGC